MRRNHSDTPDTMLFGDAADNSYEAGGLVCAVSATSAMSAGDVGDDDHHDRDDRDEGGGISIAISVKPKLQKPSLYKVLLLNDDYTPMEFVVHVLQKFFHKSLDEATQIMLNVHRRGIGICGVYTYEIAETKATQVMDLAQREQHPLQLRIEKE